VVDPLQLELVFIGKTKEQYLQSGIEDYAKRLSRYLKVKLKTVKEIKPHKGMPDDLLITKESENLLQQVQGDYLICLDRTGKQFDSRALADHIKRWELQPIKRVTFVIGGHLGLSEDILKKADMVLSLSPMTFTHDMSRLILLEQLYRACTIKKGEKYHK
jgi:23S rRNA (pseudouridine1915-N3)-methyltransferase